MIWPRRKLSNYARKGRAGFARLVATLALSSAILASSELATAAIVYREAKLQSPSPGTDWDNFGGTVALSGDTALLSGHTGAYVFVKSGGAWSLQQAIPIDNPIPFMEVALSGDTALIGNSNGHVFAFVRTSGVWSLQAELGPGGGRVGESLAIDGDTALVGDPGRCVTVNPRYCPGAVNVYLRSGGVWTLQQELLGAADGDDFGSAVAISGDTAIIGAETNPYPGKAYAYVRSTGVWSKQQELVPDQPPESSYGAAVALSGDTAIVGAPGTVQSAAFVFIRNAGTWTLQQRLPDPAMSWMYDGLFGLSVALSGDNALVGSPWGPGLYGAAVLFTRSGGKWTRQMTFSPSERQKYSEFGNSVALSGGTVLSVARVSNVGGVTRGAAFMFTPAAGAELMTNGGMEIDTNGDKVPDGWQRTYWTATDGRTTTVKHSGTASVKLTAKGTRKSLRKTILRSGAEGDALVLSAWVRTSGTPANVAGTHIRLFVYNGAALQTSRSQYVGGGTHTFVKEALNYQATGPYTKLVVMLDCWDYQGSAWFDTVSLARAPR